MRRGLTVFALLAVLCGFPLQALANAPGLTQDDATSVGVGTEYYDTSNPAAACAGSPATAPGSIGANVGRGMTASAQQKFQQILVAAGQKFNVDPNYIAAFYYAENGSAGGDSTNNGDSATAPPQTGDGKWREPPPPYGSGSPWLVGGSDGATWPDGTTGAHGPFQFEPDTWSSEGVNANGGGGAPNALDLADAAFAAAKYVGSAGGTAGASDAKLLAAAEVYNHSSTYAQSVLNTFHYLSGSSATVAGSPGGCAAAGGTAGYKNPLRDIPDLVGERVDEGIDYGGDGPVYAIGTGTLNFATNNTGWPSPGSSTGGTFISYKLTDPSGAANGLNVYVAENCTINPAILTNPALTSNTVLCTMHNVSPTIETGWADADPSAGNLAAAHVEYTGHDGYPTEYGVNFGQFMKSLGDTTSHTHDYPTVIGTLPAKWPTWD